MTDVIERATKATPENAESLRADLESLRREALIANPLVSGQPILFVARPQYHNEHGTQSHDVSGQRDQHPILPWRRGDEND
ncbi:MAG: hypothetical protein ABIP48_33700 [Planctomycetota bacterium]